MIVKSFPCWIALLVFFKIITKREGLRRNRAKVIKKLIAKDEKQVCNTLRWMHKPEFKNSFAGRYPEKAKSWSKRNICNPNQVSWGSPKKFVFNCSRCNHEFLKSPKGAKERWCPYCTHQKLCTYKDCYYCYNHSFASHKEAKNWSNRNKISPRHVFKKTDKKYWFDCDNCSHEFKIGLNSIHAGKWCPYCVHIRMCYKKDCEMCFKNSFASHERAKDWNYELNECTPREVFKSSNYKYWFICDKCNHDFKIRPNQICKGEWCSYCSNQRLCNDKDCKMCFENSFASHERSKNWSDRNKVSPRKVFKSARDKYWFDCDKCNHDFKISLSSISCGGNWCSYCAHVKLCNDEDCKMCFQNSFASHERSENWSDKNSLFPRDVFKNDHDKYWFYCDKCDDDFKSSPNSIVKGTWCPNCSQKRTENKMHEHLKIKYKDIEREKRHEWCKNKRCLPFDFYIPSINAFVECDGIQHFKFVEYFVMSLQERQKRDRYKELCALKHGISVIRIFQEDVLFDKTNWKEELEKKFEECKNAKVPKVHTIGGIYGAYNIKVSSL
jgi:hypothetical protein